MRELAYLDHAVHHAHHLVDEGDHLVGALGGADLRSVLARQYIPAGHIEHVGGGQLKVDGGAVRVIYNSRQKRVFSCDGISKRRTKGRNVSIRGRKTDRTSSLMGRDSTHRSP